MKIIIFSLLILAACVSATAPTYNKYTVYVNHGKSPSGNSASSSVSWYLKPVDLNALGKTYSQWYNYQSSSSGTLSGIEALSTSSFGFVQQENDLYLAVTNSKAVTGEPAGLINLHLTCPNAADGLCGYEPGPIAVLKNDGTGDEYTNEDNNGIHYQFKWNWTEGTNDGVVFGALKPSADGDFNNGNFENNNSPKCHKLNFNWNKNANTGFDGIRYIRTFSATGSGANVIYPPQNNQNVLAGRVLTSDTTSDYASQQADQTQRGSNFNNNRGKDQHFDLGGQGWITYQNDVTFHMWVCKDVDRDCVVQWTDSSACSASCNRTGQTSVKQQTGTVTQQPSGNGQACPPLTRTVPCDVPVCPQNCEVSEWQDVQDAQCSKTCGSDSVMPQYRTITTPQLGAGAPCPPLQGNRPCDVPACPVDCVLSDWVDHGCEGRCGTGTRTRTRTREVAPQNGGVACGDLTETEECDTGIPCPVDCVVSDWTNEGSCVGECGTGKQKQVRVITTQPVGAGQGCPSLTQFIDCNTGTSCDVDCTVGSWRDVGTCAGPCGERKQNQVRDIIHDKVGNGQDCPNLHQAIPCNQHEQCENHQQNDTHDVNCTLSDWRDRTECPECGTGSKTQYRTILVNPRNNGTACDDLVREVPCTGLPPCPQDCEVSDWRDSSPCSVTCGRGTKNQTRTVTQQPVGTGRPCPDLERSMPCEMPDCPVDCLLSEWTDDSQGCQGTCGTGTLHKFRTVVRYPQGAGLPCPDENNVANYHQYVPCNTGITCPVDCQHGPWIDGPCCGGVRTQTRVITRQPEGNGTPCLALSQDVACDTDDADCESGGGENNGGNEGGGGNRPCQGNCGQGCVGDWTATTADSTGYNTDRFASGKSVTLCFNCGL